MPVIPSWDIIIGFNFRRTSGTNRNTIRDAQWGCSWRGTRPAPGKPAQKSGAQPSHPCTFSSVWCLTQYLNHRFHFHKHPIKEKDLIRQNLADHFYFTSSPLNASVKLLCTIQAPVERSNLAQKLLPPTDKEALLSRTPLTSFLLLLDNLLHRDF